MNEDGYGGLLFGLDDGAGVSCKVFPRGDAVEAHESGQLLASLPYAGMKISVTGMDDRYLCFEAAVDGTDLRLLVPDKQIAPHIQALGAPRAIVDQLGGAAKVRTRRKVGRLSVMAVLGGILIALVLVAWALFEWAVDKVVDQIPPEWEVELGRATASDVLAQHNVCVDPALNGAVQELGQRLVGGMGASPYRWHVRVLDDEDVNAFALPGGYLFINRGLIDKSADGYQVAGVLAHEMQHVALRHGIRNLVRQVGLMLIVYAVVGDASAVERLLVGSAADLASMSFSRDQEREADQQGLALIYNAAMDPFGLPRFLQVIAAEEGAVESALTLVSTHPASADRVTELNETIQAWGQRPVTPLASDWAGIKNRCTPIQITDPDQI